MTLHGTAFVPVLRKALVACTLGAIAGIAPAIASEPAASEQEAAEQETSPAQEQVVDVAHPAPPPPPRPTGLNRPLRPKGNPGTWVLPGDYPRKAMRDGIEGTAYFTLSVGSDGRPTACNITKSSGNAELDAATCTAFMRRARFDPKLVDGKPVRSTFSNRMEWTIPH